MNTRVKIIVIVLALSILFTYILYTFSEEQRISSGGFTRSFRHDVISNGRSFSVPYEYFQVAGTYGNSAFLTIPDKNRLMVLDIPTLDTVYKHLQVDTPSARVTIDSPFFYAADYVNYRISKGDLNSLRISQTLLDSIVFAEFIPIQQEDIIFRTLTDDLSEFVLAKYSHGKIDIRPDILEKQIDGRFCTDGMLRFNKKSQKIIYAYYYRNQFMCMDENLNLLYQSHTIDTVSRAQIKVSHIASENYVTLSTPPRIVNQNLHTEDQYIYIESVVKSDNETVESFIKNSVIDVYRIADGKYLSSFYIPTYNTNKLEEFRIIDQYLLAVYPHDLVIYDLHKEHLSIF